MSAELSILYEDAQLAVCCKPAGVASEDGGSAPGLPELLRRRWGAPSAFVGVVHRLDVGVSGLMVCARTPAAAAALSRQITAAQQAHARLDAGQASPPPRFVKGYRAVIAGGPDGALPPEGVLRDLLFKDSRRGRVFPVDRPRKGVKDAALDYRILSTVHPSEPLSLVEITLHTGRTHQIRVQFASRRHPLWGDGKYGSRYKGAIALQSARLCFDHPADGRRMEFCLPVPDGAPWELFHS